MDKLLSLEEQITSLDQALITAQQGYTPVEHFTDRSQQAHCPAHGTFTQFVRTSASPFGNKLTFENKCPACLLAEKTRLTTELNRLQEMASERKRAKLLAESGVPERFAHASFEGYRLNAKTPEGLQQQTRAKKVCERYALGWSDRFTSGGGLVLCGKPGTGKNHLACAIINHVIRQHFADAYLTTALRIMRKVKSTWQKNTDLTEDEVIAFYVNKDLLVIDEIGVQFGSDTEKMVLFEIINDRYEQMRPTILISNLPENELTRYVGERVLDRMRDDNGMTLAFDWESFRK